MAARNPAPAPAKPAPRSRAGSAKSPPVAPLLDAAGKKSKDVTLEESVFAADVRPHLVHETVRAELNARRAGTHGVKSRGLVSGGRSKPWRQKGTGRARAGTIRAPQFEGGGVAFQPRTNFEVKVNRKARKAALASALSDHAQAGSLAIVAPFDSPSTKSASGLLAQWGRELPLLVVAGADDAGLIKSFRNLDRVVVTVPAELEVSQLVWARSVLISEAALEAVQGRAQ
jgi:large subunit ribosomal protein L4